MLKRNIAILIAGGLLSAQVNLAAADQGASPVSAVPPSYDAGGGGWQPPALTKYLEQRAASIQKEGVVLRGDSFPPSYDSGGGGWQPLVLTKYLEERAAAIQRETGGDVYETIKISASTKDVTVEHFGTVKIANDKGQSFVWTFDTMGEAVVPLKTIAPAGFAAGDTTVYVRHPAAHIQG